MNRSKTLASSLLIAVLVGSAGATALAQQTAPAVQAVDAAKEAAMKEAAAQEAKMKAEVAAKQAAISAEVAKAAGSAAPAPLTPEMLKQLQEIAAKEGEATGPRLTWLAETKEFGVINDDSPVVHDFAFANTGTADLTISDTKGSCGCTVPNLEKKVYKPGEGGSVRVSFNPHGRRNRQHTTVTVTSNDAKRPSVQLHLQSDVKPLMVIDPQFQQMSPALKGNTAKSMATITVRKEGLVPTQVTPSSARLTAALGAGREATVDGEKVMQYPVEITLSPTAEVGQFNEQVTVRTSDPSRIIYFTVGGEVLGDVEVAPVRLQFPGLNFGQDVSQVITLKSRSGKTFKIIDAKDVPMGAPFFSSVVATEDPALPGTYKITCTGKAPTVQGAIRGDVVVTTDNPEQPIVKINYFGFTKAPQPTAPATVKPAATTPALKEQPSSLTPPK